MSSWTAIVTCLALVLYLVHAVQVTLARGRYIPVAVAPLKGPIHIPKGPPRRMTCTRKGSSETSLTHSGIPLLNWLPGFPGIR